MFVFKIYQGGDSTNEEFSSAIDCAKTCIESVLYDLNATVAVEGNQISIVVSNIKEKECWGKIKGCFRDSSGTFYPEFLHVESIPQNA